MRRGLFAIYLCLLALLTLSCVRDVEIDLGELPDRIVLNASVCPDSEVRAHISKTWFIMDSVPDFDLPDATVRVYINDQFRGTMRNDDLPGDSVNLRGQYVLPGCFVSEGDRIRLEAEANGYEPVSGETVIPARAGISRIDTSTFRASPYLASYMRLFVRLKDVGDEHYRLIVERVTDYKKGDSVWTVTSFQNPGPTLLYIPYLSLNYEDPVFQSYGGSPIVSQMDGRFCMGVFAGRDMMYGNTVKVSLWPVDYSYVGDSISTVVRYKVRLLSISEEYYRYMKIMRGFSITIGDANFGALIEPADAYSNVENGFGIVAGYQVSEQSLTMPLDTVPPRWDPWYGYSSL